MARSTAQRLATYQSRYREHVAQFGDVGYIAVPISRPAQRLPAPIRRDLPCQLADTGGSFDYPERNRMNPAQRTHGARLAIGNGFFVVCLLGLVACSTSASSPGSSQKLKTGTTLDKPLSSVLLSLPLTDEHGKRFTLGSLSGKTIVLVPFLTTCQEICPMTSVNMRDVAASVKASGQSSSVVELEITVDPGRDDAARLGAYQKLFGTQPGWDLATAGTSGTATLWKELGVYYGKVPSDTPPSKDWLTGKALTYDVNHQDIVFIIDDRGHTRWLTDGTPNTAGVKPPATLVKFLSDVGRKNLASPPQPSWTVADVESGLSSVTGHHIGL